MTFVVTDACILCKFMDCVTVCPVDCFRQGETMLVIDPETCIDCGACVPACPAEAIFPDTFDVAQEWLSLNADMAGRWPAITEKGNVSEDATEWIGVSGKFRRGFSPSPGR